MISLKRLFTAQGIVMFGGSVGYFVFARPQLPAFLAGSGLITLNFVLLAAVWKRILDKKAVARTIVIVVFKYAILGVLLYYFVRVLKLPVIPLFVGLSTVGLSALAAFATIGD
jgi:hypothetical protein